MPNNSSMAAQYCWGSGHSIKFEQIRPISHNFIVKNLNFLSGQPVCCCGQHCHCQNPLHSSSAQTIMTSQIRTSSLHLACELADIYLSKLTSCQLGEIGSVGFFIIERIVTRQILTFLLDLIYQRIHFITLYWCLRLVLPHVVKLMRRRLVTL
jgi:hypothetical protein